MANDDVIIKIKEVEDGIEGAPPWITTFVDMVSLLVTFFILLFTFSAIQDFEVFTLPQQLVGTPGLSKKSGDTIDAPEVDVMQAMDNARGARNPHSRPKDQLSENLEEMGQKMTEEHLELDASNVADGLRITFDERGAFAPGSAVVNPVLAKSLREFGGVMEHYRHMVVVEGFTDSQFKPTSRYPSAESLSLARAAAAAKVILESSNTSAHLLQVSGMGASGGEPSETSLDRRRKRRVEVRILSLSKARAAAIAAEEEKD